MYLLYNPVAVETNLFFPGYMAEASDVGCRTRTSSNGTGSIILTSWTRPTDVMRPIHEAWCLIGRRLDAVIGVHAMSWDAVQYWKGLSPTIIGYVEHPNRERSIEPRNERLGALQHILQLPNSLTSSGPRAPLVAALVCLCGFLGLSEGCNQHIGTEGKIVGN